MPLWDPAVSRTQHFGDPRFPGSNIRASPNKTFRNRDVFPQIECSWVNGSRNVPESNDGMEKWVGKQSERGRKGEKEKEREGGGEMSIYLALTKKKKKRKSSSTNCRFKRRGNLEDRSNLESIFQRLPPPLLFFILLLFFSLSSYLRHALIVIKGEVVFCNLGL